jgi:hypothetical protein
MSENNNKLYVLSFKDQLEKYEYWKLAEVLQESMDRVGIDGEIVIVNGKVEAIDKNELIEELK